MAITAHTVFPIKAVGGMGGTQAVPQMVLPLDVSETISDGDIMTVAAATKDLEDNNTPTEQIVGVANISAETDIVSGATVDRDTDVIHVVPAFANLLFAGNIVTDATTDETGVYVDNIMELMGIVEADTPTTAAPAQASGGTTTIKIIRYQQPQTALVAGVMTYRAGAEAGVGVTNPRAIFTFLHALTIWD